MNLTDFTHKPLEFARLLWPQFDFYKQQREVIESVRDNDETVVVAGNMLGKDFVAGFIVLWFFMTRTPCRIVTTSAKEDHLRVLWGEIGRFIQDSRKPLDVRRGGPLIINHLELRHVYKGEIVKLSYVKGMVAAQDSLAAMGGHHIAQTGDGIPRTLFLPDECSSVTHEYYIKATTWMNRMLAIGNPWPCNNFFKWSVLGKPGTKDKGGDIRAERNGHYLRKVFQIRAVDSPNVIRAHNEIKAGKVPSGKIIIPGVKPYSEYLKNRKRWDAGQQKVSLDAEFDLGSQRMLFPIDWIDDAEKFASALPLRRQGKVMGVDTAQGGDNTCWVIADKDGIIEMVSMKTPDTSEVMPKTLQLAQEFGVRDRDVYFDAGGGGKEHANYLERLQGFKPQVVFFGGTPTIERTRAMVSLETRKNQDETRMIFANRRAEMYGLLRMRLDPLSEQPFGMPEGIINREREDGGPSLREQLQAIPFWHDSEGKLLLPPKNRKPKSDGTEDDKTMTLIDMIGCSPDEADALVLAIFGLRGRGTRTEVRVG